MFEPCPPAEWTPPLTTDFPNVADRFLPALDLVFRVAFGRGLLEWQKNALRCITEIDPATGTLRWRQFLVLVPRQQGKTHLVSALVLIWLLWRAGEQVISVASNAEQARILFKRTLDLIRSNQSLGRRFRKATESRGIVSTNGSSYDVRAAKGSVLQGIPISLGVVDEVHIVMPELWNALLNGTGGRNNAMVVGISTAGDDNSEQLHHLIEEGQAGRIGLLWWRASTDQVPADDAELGNLLLEASPSLAEGLAPLDNAIADARTLPSSDVVRYKLNRHTGTTDNFVPVSIWLMGQQEPVEAPTAGVVYAIDRSPEWEYATLTASWRLPEGHVWTEVVASVVRPSPAGLVEMCSSLAGRGDARAFVMDSYSLKQVGAELKLRGVAVQLASLSDVAAASALFYANTVQRKINHPGDPLLSVQLPGAKRKNVPGSEAFRVSRSSGALSIDAVMATVLGCYFAETLPDLGPQLFV